MGIECQLTHGVLMGSMGDHEEVFVFRYPFLPAHLDTVIDAAIYAGLIWVSSGKSNFWKYIHVFAVYLWCGWK